MIICDTREQKNQHILKYFERHDIKHIIATVGTGDYISDKAPGIAVERKQNLNELSHNLLSRDRGRFYREIRRARSQGTKLFIVCEHGHDINCIEDVVKWVNPYGRVTGKVLREAIYKCAIGYGCEFIFCDRRHTGKIIAELLNGG